MYGVFISELELAEINHRIVNGDKCVENLDSLEVEYENLYSKFLIQKDIIIDKDFQISIQNDIYKEKKRKWFLWSGTVGVFAFIAGLLI